MIAIYIVPRAPYIKQKHGENYKDTEIYAHLHSILIKDFVFYDKIKS